jgi:hypothetical protein
MSQIAILLLNRCSISVVFPIVRFAGDQKTALSGESLYTVCGFTKYLELTLGGAKLRKVEVHNVGG